MQILQPSAMLLKVTGDPQLLIERCGRICYKSESHASPGTDEKLVRFLLDRHHESVVEHAVATILIVCDRGVSHEIVRHRLASYSQESTRYCNYGSEKHGGEISVIKPPGLSDASSLYWETAMRDSEIAYLAMLADGMSPQIARSVLPTCLKTELAMTTNFREWRHFLKLRLAPAAHPQIREVASMIRDILLPLAPVVFGEFSDETNAR
jgi:thymidylate synthase (FAD)